MYNAICAFLLVLASPFLLALSFGRKYKVLLSDELGNSRIPSKNSRISSENSRIPSKNQPKNSILARFFLLNNPALKPCDFYFHACSLGEVSTIEPFVKALQKEAKSVRITVCTATGYARAREFCDEVAFLPFECFLPFWLKECKTLVVFEAELWLNLFACAKKQGAKVILLNARLSQSSLPKYRRFLRYYQTLFSYCDLVLAQSESDAKRLEAIGAKNIKVLGNVKSALLPSPSKKLSSNYEHIIVLASSHEGEEKGILEFLRLKKGEQLIIAPRHPQRFSAVCELVRGWAEQNNYSSQCFSKNADLKAQVVVMDSLGELINIYAIADTVILAGSFSAGIGGHNPFEPASFNCGIISGAFFHNQKVLYSAVKGIKIASDFKTAALLAHEKFSSQITQSCDFNDILEQIKG